MPHQVCKPVNPGAIGNLRVNGGLADGVARLRAGEGNVRDDQPPAGLAVPETQSWLVDTENTIVCLKPEKLAGF